MKLFIYDDATGNIIQIKSSQFDMLKDIYAKFINNEEIKKSSNTFGNFLIYRNIILSGGRMKDKNYGKVLKVYDVKNNSEIWWGKIGNYIKRDDVILELCLGMIGGDSFYFITKKTDSISKIRSIIKENVDIWDMKGNKVIDENKTILDIDSDGEYYRFIIGESFEKSCKSYEEYLLKYFFGDILELRYWSQFVEYDMKSKGRSFIERLIKAQIIKLNEIDSQFLADHKNSEKYFKKLDEIMINTCKEKINNSKQEIQSNTKFDYNLPFVFLNSQFLFCVHIIDLFSDIFHFYSPSVGGFLTLTSQCAVIHYVFERRFHPNILDKSMKNILIDILDCCENIVISSTLEIKYWVKLFLDLFMNRFYTDFEIDEILYNFFNPEMESLPVIINGKHHRIYSKYPKTILDMKKMVSVKTGLPIDQLYFINYVGDQRPIDEDEFINSFSYSVEFVSNIDEIEKLKDIGMGAFGEVYLYTNKLSGEQLALKIPKRDKDLSIEINILHRMKFSSQLLSYSQLINVNGSIGLAMKYLREVINDYLYAYAYIFTDSFTNISKTFFKINNFCKL